MLRIAKLTDYATVVLTAMAAEPKALATAPVLAARTRVEVPTAAKVLKTLAQAGLLESRRGASGGYRLARAPNAITIADIVAAMEGPIGMTECVSHSGLCDHESHCGVQSNWRKISRAIESALRGVTLADMLPARRPKRIPVRLLAGGSGA